MSTKEKKLEFATRMRARISKYWLVDKGNHTNNDPRKKAAKDTEEHAQVILKELGFQYILPLNNTVKCARYINHGTRAVFPFFDYYAEKDGQKWFIDVTAYIKKWMPHTPLWERLGIKMAVLFIRRDLKQYCFREDTGKTCISLRLKDIGLAPLSVSEARRKSWETRRKQGNDQGWSRGLTAETDERMARNTLARTGKPHPHKGRVSPSISTLPKILPSAIM